MTSCVRSEITIVPHRIESNRIEYNRIYHARRRGRKKSTKGYHQIIIKINTKKVRSFIHLVGYSIRVKRSISISIRTQTKTLYRTALYSRMERHRSLPYRPLRPYRLRPPRPFRLLRTTGSCRRLHFRLPRHRPRPTERTVDCVLFLLLLLLVLWVVSGWRRRQRPEMAEKATMPERRHLPMRGRLLIEQERWMLFGSSWYEMNWYELVCIFAQLRNGMLFLESSRVIDLDSLTVR